MAIKGDLIYAKKLWDAENTQFLFFFLQAIFQAYWGSLWMLHIF